MSNHGVKLITPSAVVSTSKQSIQKLATLHCMQHTVIFTSVEVDSCWVVSCSLLIMQGNNGNFLLISKLCLEHAHGPNALFTRALISKYGHTFSVTRLFHFVSDRWWKADRTADGGHCMLFFSCCWAQASDFTSWHASFPESNESSVSTTTLTDSLTKQSDEDLYTWAVLKAATLFCFDPLCGLATLHLIKI